MTFETREIHNFQPKYKQTENHLFELLCRLMRKMPNEN